VARLATSVDKSSGRAAVSSQLFAVAVAVSAATRCLLEEAGILGLGSRGSFLGGGLLSSSDFLNLGSMFTIMLSFASASHLSDGVLVTEGISHTLGFHELFSLLDGFLLDVHLVHEGTGAVLNCDDLGLGGLACCRLVVGGISGPVLNGLRDLSEVTPVVEITFAPSMVSGDGTRLDLSSLQFTKRVLLDGQLFRESGDVTGGIATLLFHGSDLGSSGRLSSLLILFVFGHVDCLLSSAVVLSRVTFTLASRDSVETISLEAYAGSAVRVLVAVSLAIQKLVEEAGAGCGGVRCSYQEAGADDSAS